MIFRLLLTFLLSACFSCNSKNSEQKLLNKSNPSGLYGNMSKAYDKVYGVDETMQASRVTTGSQYKAPHSGWVGITTYVDCHGNLRVKSETFVAMSGITTNNQGTGTFVLPA